MQVGMWTLSSDLSVGLATGEFPAPRMRIETPSPMVTRFRCADDRWLSFCMPGDRHWVTFCGALGHPDWVDDPRFADAEARAENAPELILAVDEVMAEADRDTWAERLDAAGLTWEPIQSLPDVAADPQAEPMGAYADVEGLDRPIRTLNAPLHLHGSESRVRGRAPAHGEHSRQILA
jgi:crotonobetainyl-CoA:carnitine CoA-transferase CaiB-like acyl-CoA transferase